MRKPISSSIRRSAPSAGLTGALPDPGFIEFCDPTLREEPPTGTQWLYEIKADGYRAQVHLKDNSVTLECVAKLGASSVIWLASWHFVRKREL